MFAEKTHEAIDKYIEDNQESSHRRHLGASVIGRSCARQLWYLFRWAEVQKFEGRMLRLFERGQLEEDRFVKWLRGIGCEVWEKDNEGEQYRIEDHHGHLGGSLDCVIKGLPELPNEAVLGEFKTHNEKSFALFATKKLIAAKYEHYVQMQVYMGKYGFNHGLYMAVNKNNDELYLEIVPFHQDVYTQALDKAKFIIFASEAPTRISKTPGWWECRFCAFKDICHNKCVAEINCRTCIFSTPVEKKKWQCERYEKPVIMRPDNIILTTGCEQHIFLPDMIGGAKLINVAPNKKCIHLEIDGKNVVHGPNFNSSLDLTIPF